MGSLLEEQHQGMLCLEPNVSAEFKNVLTKTAHTTPDSFVEHLLDLFVKTQNTESLKIRLDVAQRFSALQSCSQFQSSNGLMSHLLQLHLQHSKTVPNDTIKSEKPGRKSRKSQPKRSLKHTIWLDSQAEEEGESASEPTQSWREKSLSSCDDNEANNNQTNMTFDLSVVKQEVMDEDDVEIKLSKDADHNRKPSGSALHISKSLWNGRSRQDAQRNELSSQEKPTPMSEGLPALLRLSYNQNNHSNVEANARNTRQFNQQDWRSKSEPMVQLIQGQLGQRSLQTESFSNQISQKGQVTKKFNESENAEFSGYPILGQILDKRRNNNENVTLPSQESDRNGYNYVLNSLASDSVENSQSDSLPESPMHVPVKYPTSTPYSLSSDEDEPEDLSFNTEQPQNLCLSKTAANAKEIVDKQSENVKYDSNANAVVSMPMGIISQLPNGQFIAQPRFNAPPNLIFHERSGGQNTLIGQPQILSSQNNGSSGGGSIPGNQGAVFVPANSSQPHLQLVNIRGQNPLTSPVFIPQGMISPNSGKFNGLSPPMLIPVTSPDGMTNMSSAQTGSMLSNQQNGVMTFEVKQEDQQALLRKKRKKMDDTTAFRDPPEQSLPFNGPNKFRFYCDVCDTGFTRRYTFNRHKCKGRVEKHYCQLCDKAYLSKYKLKDHILVKHEGQTVNCPDCGKRFSSRSSMEMHKKQQHEGLFTIWCKVCGKGFNHTGHYYGHMNKHTNTKPFWCQQCGKRFYGSSYLHNHKQVCRGNNDLNFACTICERKFKCELYLKKHMKVHDNVPIIQNQDIPKMTGDALSALGIESSMHESDVEVENGLDASEDIYDGPVFPNAPEMSDSNTKNLILDEADGEMVADDTNLNSTAESSKLVKDDSVIKQAVTA